MSPPSRSRKTAPWYEGKTPEELEAVYREREKVERACGHPERRGIIKRGRIIDICMSCGQVRVDERRSYVAFVPKDYAHADKMLKAVSA